MFNKLFSKLSPATPLTPADPADATVQFYAPLSGSIIPLEQVSDPVFSQKMLGDGFAIKPSSAQVLAPFDCTVIAVFPTGHAIGLRSTAGLECLIHIGLNTVDLNGQGFHLLVEQDQILQQGTPLIDLDLPLLLASGKDLVTPLVITNSTDWLIDSPCDKLAVAGETLLFVARRKGEQP